MGRIHFLKINYLDIFINIWLVYYHEVRPNDLKLSSYGEILRQFKIQIHLGMLEMYILLVMVFAKVYTFVKTQTVHFKWACL